MIGRSPVAPSHSRPWSESFADTGGEALAQQRSDERVQFCMTDRRGGPEIAENGDERTDDV
jgi:hypothetical protein